MIRRVVKWVVGNRKIRQCLLDSGGRICSRGSLPPWRLREGRLADEVLRVPVEVAGVKAALLGGLARGVADALLRLGTGALVSLVRTETFMSWVTGQEGWKLEAVVVDGREG